MVILSVDYGDARTGLAVFDKDMMLARPAGLIQEISMDKTVIKIIEAVQQYGAERVVVGLPKNMDGTLGERAEKCQKVARKIAGRLNATDIQVDMYDERATTVMSIGILNELDIRGKKRKQTVDQVAATVILEDYIRYLKNTSKKNTSKTAE